MFTLPIRWAEGADTSLPLPSYETAGSVGVDLRANFAQAQRAVGVVLEPMARALISTGLHLEIPQGFEAQIRPRSGLALKHGVTLMNAPGTIDSDYRGEVKVILINHGSESFAVRRGDRIAQLVLAPVVQARWNEVDELDETARGAGGFGSTGGHAKLV